MMLYRKICDDLMEKLVKEKKIKQVVLLDPSIKEEWRKAIPKLVDDAMMAKFPKKYPTVKAAIESLQ